MKMIFLLSLCCLLTTLLSAQEKVIFYNGSIPVHQSRINNVDSVSFVNVISIVHHNDGTSDFSFPVVGLDSIVFADADIDIPDTGIVIPDSGNIVYIIYNGSNVTVINPFASSGVTVSDNGAFVTVNAVSGPPTSPTTCREAVPTAISLCTATAVST